jgi:hypothetical protein
VYTLAELLAYGRGTQRRQEACQVQDSQETNEAIIAGRGQTFPQTHKALYQREQCGG